jgi:RNA polymerase sigma factor (sigma-70 family)
MSGARLRSVIRGATRAVAARGAGGLADAELLRRWVAQRDEAAFEALLWRHAAAVLGVCRRVLGDAHEAEDAAQAAFLALARQARSIGRRQAVASWLYTVAYRAALRARARRPCYRPAPILGLDAVAVRPAEDPAWRDLRPVLDEEVSRLPEKYRAAFVACHVEGRTNEEAARELGCPVGTVVSRLARARRLLRERLTRRGVTLGAGGLAAALAGEAAQAAVPAAVVGGVVRAAVLAAAGERLAGAVSSEVVALAEGVVRAMLLTKVKLVAAVVVGLALLGGGGVLSYRAAAGAVTPGGREARPQGDKLPTQPAQKEKEVRDLQDRVKALEQALAETHRRLELALISRTMDDVKERLASGAGGPITRLMQRDVVAHLDNVLRDAEDGQKRAPDPKLRDTIAELKMLCAMQARVNARTEVYGKEYEGEVAPAPTTGKDRQERERLETLHRELKDLSERQAKLSGITLELARPRKRGG